MMNIREEPVVKKNIQLQVRKNLQFKQDHHKVNISLTSKNNHRQVSFLTWDPRSLRQFSPNPNQIETSTSLNLTYSRSEREIKILEFSVVFIEAKRKLAKCSLMYKEKK